MAYFQDVHPGDKFQPNVLLSNNIRHLLNSLNGFTNGGIKGAPSGIVRVKVFCSSALESGQAVNFKDGGKFCDDAIPCIPLTDPAKPWGVIDHYLSTNEIGECIISGPVTVKVKGDSGDCAEPVKGKKYFQRGGSGAQILFVCGDEETDADGNKTHKAVLNLGGGGGASLTYNGYFKITDATGEDKQFRVRVADGATGGNSICKVNNMTFSVAPWESEAISATKAIVLKFTARTKNNATEKVEIVALDKLPNDESTVSYCQIGRVIVNTDTKIIQQDTMGIPQIWWYLNCDELDEILQ